MELSELFASFGQSELEGPLLEAVEKNLLALGEKGLTPGELRRVQLKANRILDRVEMDSYPKVRTLPGVPELLERLSAKGIRTAVQSRACRAYVAMSLERIGHPFAAVLAREDVVRPKPEPEGMLLLLVKLGCAPGDCACVGDHPFDIQAGKRAGVKSAGVLSGAGTEEALKAAGADAVFKRAGPELLAWLDGA